MQVLARSSVLVLAVPRMALGLVLVLFACPTAGSQTPLYLFQGNGDLGRSVSGAGDVNADGFADLIVGAPLDGAGSALVFSGLDGSTLYTFNGDSQQDWFGVSVSGAGDVNLDGFADLVVGAWFADINGTDSGYARVFSGVDGSILYTLYGNSTNDKFGVSVSGAGDVNGDGFDDVIVGAHGDNQHRGSAQVFSGVDGSILYTFEGNSSSARFGWSVSGGGDVNGDGVPDLIVGARHSHPHGRAYVFSGLNGSVLYTWYYSANFDHIGFSVSDAGDVNADGFDDVIAGAPYNDNNGTLSGSARVFSGVDGSVLYTFDGDTENDYLGYSVSGAGDVNGDGFDDLIVGAWQPTYPSGPGYARVFSGMDGTVLYTFYGDAQNDDFGFAVSGAGDVNGDGSDDVIVGAPLDYNVLGFAQVFASRRELGTSYCGPVVPNSTGKPGVVRAFGLNGVNANEVFLTADQLPNGPFGYFLVSRTQGSFMPPASQGFICLGGNIGRYNQPGNIGQGPTFSIQVDLTAVPQPTGRVAVQPGDTWNFQAWYRDIGGTNNFTDGVEILFQ